MQANVFVAILAALYKGLQRFGRLQLQINGTQFPSFNLRDVQCNVI